jgi:hypothetical protein
MTAPLLVDETPAKSAFESEADESIESAAGVAHEIGTAAQLMVIDALVFSKGSLHRSARGDARVRHDASGMPASAGVLS